MESGAKRLAVSLILFVMNGPEERRRQSQLVSDRASSVWRTVINDQYLVLRRDFFQYGQRLRSDARDSCLVIVDREEKRHPRPIAHPLTSPPSAAQPGTI